MGKQIQKITPDYTRIYSDIITQKYPQKWEECRALLQKNTLSRLDIIVLNSKIFGKTDRQSIGFNQKFRSYTKADIMQMLDYQKQHNLNNVQLATHFRISRNSVTKWKKMFLT